MRNPKELEAQKFGPAPAPVSRQAERYNLIGTISSVRFEAMTCIFEEQNKKSEIVMGVIFPKFVKSLQHFFDLNETKTQLEKNDGEKIGGDSLLASIIKDWELQTKEDFHIFAPGCSSLSLILLQAAQLRVFCWH